MSYLSLPRVRRLALIALGVAITALIVALFYANHESAGAAGTTTPANKVWVEGSTVEFMHSQGGPATPTEVITDDPDEVVLSTSTIRYNNPTDLRLSVTAECALWTNTATYGDDDAESKARVELWITIDGKTVPVSSDDTSTGSNSVDPDQQAGRGRVVFCNRATRMKTENIENTTVPPPSVGPPVADQDDEDDIVIRSYNRSREANAFNWGALNVGVNYDDPANGKGLVVVQVHSRLATSLRDEDSRDNTTDSPAALAAVGKRTLFVEPVHMAHDATF